MIDSPAVSPLRLRFIFACDRARFALRRRRQRPLWVTGADVSPNFRLAEVFSEPGARLVLRDGVVTERRCGNAFNLYRDSALVIGERTWLRTDYGTNRITAYAGARIEVGPDGLLNGAMLHAKRRIRIGREARIAFGVRVLDADLHDLDRETPERIAPVEIGDRVWLGADALVLRGVTIGDDVVVAAGSVVTRDLPSRCLAVGAPAVPIREIAPRTGCC